MRKRTGTRAVAYFRHLPVDNRTRTEHDMITDAAAIDMLHTRLAADDPTLTATEVVLLRSAFERLDDWLVWLDRHVALTHGSDDSATAVLQFLGGVRNKIARELNAVDAALGSVEP